MLTHSLLGYLCPVLYTNLPTCLRLPICLLICSVAIRLVGKNGQQQKSAGRVEVLHNTGSHSRWGTVCRYSFDIKAATVVCKELGFEGAEMVVPCCDVFGKGTGRIWLSGVKCLGTEPSITMCPHSGWGSTYCSHDDDVSVICKTDQTDRTGRVMFDYCSCQTKNSVLFKFFC